MSNRITPVICFQSDDQEEAFQMARTLAKAGLHAQIKAVYGVVVMSDELDRADELIRERMKGEDAR